jgi:membrane protein insertase Oxa1/YidC/SpoIIIJ
VVFVDIYMVVTKTQVLTCAPTIFWRQDQSAQDERIGTVVFAVD